uniref:Uncharacterized protein n=1 Tax=Mola mola TaxID=94237 RepID=A0A3Q3WDY0_MOLML
MKRNKQIDVKRALALARAFTFMCSCARGCVLPFLTLYFRQLGLPPAMTGVVMGTKHLITLVWRPMASLLSKHYNKRRVVITGSLVCSAAVAIVLLLIQPADMHMQTSTCNMSGAPAQNLGGDLLKTSAGSATTPNASDGYSSSGVWALLGAACGVGGAGLLVSQLSYVAMPGAERNMMRVYIALSLHLGSGLGSFVGGLVVQRFGLTWLFRGAAVGLILWCVCLPLLQWNAPRQHRINYSRLLAADASETSDSESEQERDWLNKAMEDDKKKWEGM